MTKPKGKRPDDNGDEYNERELILTALDHVTQTLTVTNKRLGELAQILTTSRAAPHPVTGPTAEINIWEDDPFSEASPSPNPSVAVPIKVRAPSNGFTKLQTAIAEPQPPVGRYRTGTTEFRYWIAAEALARGINFWGELLPAGTTWSTSNPMAVRLLENTPNLNAFYARKDGLHFFKRKVSNQEIYSGESPDVVCHELGHATLDALKPQLFQTASTEVAAFHEAFGDMSAILCALQLPSMRANVIAETGGRLKVNSRLSRLAEQLGWGIRQLSPTAVDRDSLRNAANRFFYRRPDQLPPSAPADLLSTEAHSYSRVFTGAFLDALASMFATTGGTSLESSLLAVSKEIGQLLVDAVHTTPVSVSYFSQVAAAMVQADQTRFGGRYRSALTRAFVDRGILDLSSISTLATAPEPDVEPVTAAAMGMVAMPTGTPSLLRYAGEPVDEAFRLGHGETPELPLRPVTISDMTIQVYAPEEKPRFAVAAAMYGALSDDSLSADAATSIFVEGLVQRGELNLGAARQKLGGGMIALVPEATPSLPTKATHSLVSEDGQLRLKRNHFNCGLCCRRAAGHWHCD